MSFNELKPGQPMCIYMTGVGIDTTNKWIVDHFNTMICQHHVKITSIERRNNAVCIYFDNWLKSRGESYTDYMNEITEAFAHGWAFAYSPNPVDEDDASSEWMMYYEYFPDVMASYRIDRTPSSVLA